MEDDPRRVQHTTERWREIGCHARPDHGRELLCARGLSGRALLGDRDARGLHHERVRALTARGPHERVDGRIRARHRRSGYPRLAAFPNDPLDYAAHGLLAPLARHSTEIPDTRRGHPRTYRRSPSLTRQRWARADARLWPQATQAGLASACWSRSRSSCSRGWRSEPARGGCPGTSRTASRPPASTSAVSRARVRRTCWRASWAGASTSRSASASTAAARASCRRPSASGSTRPQPCDRR